MLLSVCFPLVVVLLHVGRSRRPQSVAHHLSFLLDNTSMTFLFDLGFDREFYVLLFMYEVFNGIFVVCHLQLSCQSFGPWFLACYNVSIQI